MGSTEGFSGSSGIGTTGDGVSPCICWDEGLCWPGTLVTSKPEVPHQQTAPSPHFTPTPLRQSILLQGLKSNNCDPKNHHTPCSCGILPTTSEGFVGAVLSKVRKLKPKEGKLFTKATELVSAGLRFKPRSASLQGPCFESNAIGHSHCEPCTQDRTRARTYKAWSRQTPLS